MKTLGAVVAVFALMLSLGFWAYSALEAGTGRLLQGVDRTAGYLEQNRWDEAYAQTLGLQTAWDKSAGWWPLVLDHGELDGILFDLGKLKEYVANRNGPLAWGQLEELRLRLRHVPEKEAVTLKNIL